jgi:putative flippase GtrA
MMLAESARRPTGARPGFSYPAPMPDEATAVDIHARNIDIGRPTVHHRPHVRLLHGLRKPANWLQLVRFGLVGGIGFVVNLAVYALFVHPLGVNYHVAAIAAWIVAVLNNFVLNRHWTFDASDGQAHAEAMRFIVVSLVAFGVSQLLLTILVEAAGLEKVPAQALAVAGSMPFNFVGNKLWTFRREADGDGALRP